MEQDQTIKQSNIGLLGFGDLGSRLAAQALLHGCDVHVYDPKLIGADLSLGEPLDPNLQEATARKIGSLVVAASAQEVLDSSPVVHWAVSSQRLPTLPKVKPDQIVVLHDSVMHTSVEAAKKRPHDADQFAIAHCLTNDFRRVFVLDNPHGQIISEHFTAIGLSPKTLSARKHDKLMARTQGPLALLINAGLREYLAKQQDLGNLTPSGEHQKDALDDRAARWTDETIDSILRNPELPEVTLYIGAQLVKKTFTPRQALTVAGRLARDFCGRTTDRLRGSPHRFFNGQ